MTQREAGKYRLLFNHDGWCVFMQQSPYQRIGEPVGPAQVTGYVDEVAGAGCDVLLLSPVMSKIPMWPSDACPHWKEVAGSAPRPEGTAVDACYNRLKAFVEAGGDIVRLSADRARQKGLAFFFSWRMNDGHDVRREGSPLQSRFWREHPELRISGPGARTIWGRGLDFSHAAARDYQFALVRELSTRYRPDGLELDFLRFGKFFPNTTPRRERFRILNGFVERVRRMLDEEAGGVPLCVRVPNRLDLVAELGLDLAGCVGDGLVGMVNAAPFIVTQPDAEVEEFRAAFPEVALYAEITHCTHYGRLIETGIFEERLITREAILAAAHSFLERGCDGISTFNFVYTRDFTFGRTPPERHREPDFEALSRTLDRDYLARASKHYLLTDERYSRQLPVALNVEDEKRFRIHVADDLDAAGVRRSVKRCVLRVEADRASPPAEFEALVDERPLEPVSCEGELFPQAPADPPDPARCGDFRVPPELLRKGWNRFTVRLVSTPAVILNRLELAIYR